MLSAYNTNQFVSQFRKPLSNTSSVNIESSCVSSLGESSAHVSLVILNQFSWPSL